MIKKIVFTSILLLGLYAVFVSLFAPQWWSAAQNQTEDNVIKAQQFIYADTIRFKNVIVGSSLSSRLLIDSLPLTYNLSFSGQSIYDGLSILLKQESLPSTIFIEMNVALLKENNHFISVLTSPILFYPKKEIRSLREDKKPIAVIGAQISKRWTNHFIIKLKYFFNFQPLTNKEVGVDKLFQKLLKLQIEAYSKVPSKELINERFAHLRTVVEKLKARGATIVFFEMPVDKALISLASANIIRTNFYQNFPKEQYQYLAPPDNVQFETTDGVHLNARSASIYTSFFRKKL